MHVGLITSNLDGLTALVESIGFVDLVIVAVEIGDAGRDDSALGVLPGALADTVTRVNGVRASARIRAEVGSPRLVTRASSLCQ